MYRNIFSMRKDQVFFFLCLSFIGGVFGGSFFSFSSLPFFFFFSTSLWFIFCISFPSRNIFFSFLFFISFSYGIFLVRQSFDTFDITNLPIDTVSGSMRIAKEPEMKNFFQEIILAPKTCVSVFCPKQRILWQAPMTMEVQVGSLIDFSCPLSLPKNFDDTFDYRMFLAKENVAYICEKENSFQILPSDYISQWYAFLFTPKKVFERAIERSLPQPEAGLALGILIGGNHRLSDSLSQHFITVGLTHIVAISGYNITLIAQGFIFLGLTLGLWRKQALWFALISIFLFVILVGAPASAVRAGIMGVCFFLGLFFGRISYGMNMLVFASASMLFFEPLLLRFDIGFVLSFLATLALILITPYLDIFFPKPFFGRSIVLLFLLTLSVELFVMPIIVYQFHIFSPIVVFMNMIILPLVPYAMMASFVTGITFLILPGLHLLPAGIAYIFLRWITVSVEQIGTIDGISQSMTLSQNLFIIWYVFLFVFFFGMRKYMYHHYVKESPF